MKHLTGATHEVAQRTRLPGRIRRVSLGVIGGWLEGVMVSLRDQTIQALRQEVAEWHGQAQALQAELEAARAEVLNAHKLQALAEAIAHEAQGEVGRLRALLEQTRNELMSGYAHDGIVAVVKRIDAALEGRDG